MHKRSFEDDAESYDDGNDEENISNDNLNDDAESTNDEYDEEYLGNANLIEDYMSYEIEDAEEYPDTVECEINKNNAAFPISFQ